MSSRIISPKFSDFPLVGDDLTSLERFLDEEVPQDGGKVHIALISALSTRRRIVPAPEIIATL